MEIIVVVDVNSNPWKVLDSTFNTCPPSPVQYNDIHVRQPAPILSKCGEVEIEHRLTGAKGRGTPVRIQ